MERERARRWAEHGLGGTDAVARRGERRLSPTEPNEGMSMLVRRRGGRGGASGTGNRTEAVYRCRNKAEMEAEHGDRRRSAVDGAGGRKRGSGRARMGGRPGALLVLKMDAGAGSTGGHAGRRRHAAATRRARSAAAPASRARESGRGKREAGLGRAEAGSRRGRTRAEAGRFRLRAETEAAACLG
jgi:hypothetical protein